MTFDRLLIYALAVLLIAIGFFKHSNNLRARSIVGNVLVGDNSGTINQSYHGAGTKATRPAPPDRVAWAIEIVGVLIAAAQLAHDLWMK